MSYVVLSGLSIKDIANPNGDIEISITGLRPGEKLYEELIIDGESKSTIHPLIYFTNEKFFSLKILQNNLNYLERSLLNNEEKKVFSIIKELVPGMEIS